VPHALTTKVLNESASKVAAMTLSPAFTRTGNFSETASSAERRVSSQNLHALARWVLLTKLILHHDDDALVKVNKRQQIIVTGPTPDIQTLRAWPNKMAEVLEQVVLEVVPERLRLRIDRHQGVLRPSPSADPALFEGDIPVVVNAGPVAQVMLHQRPSVAAIAPVVFAVPALLLGLVKCQLGVIMMQERNGPLTGPLKAHALDVFAGLRVAQGKLDQRFVRAFHGSEEHVHLQLLHFGPEDGNELGQPLSGPTAAREGLGGVKFVLGHDGPDADALLRVILDEARKVGGVGAQVAILLDELVDALFGHLIGSQPVANFTVCRMPVGANDFSLDWYSYDEVPDDFALEHFSISRDLETLVPFIKGALQYQPGLKLWASPWSPPTWMKTNKHYAAKPSQPDMPIKATIGPESPIDTTVRGDGL
jgi:hypothetical protein